MDSKQSFIHYNIFKPFEKLLAFTTSKQTLAINNARFTGDSIEDYQTSRQLLAEKLGIDSTKLVFPRQTHTNCVADINDIPKNEIAETDAIVTNQSEICICVQTADCVPILLFDPIKNVVSAVHAGWRGTVKKIVEVAVEKMIVKYQSSPKDILAAIGPSISQEIYEVGNEVVEAVKKTIPNAEKTLAKNSSGKFHFNLWEANKQILLANGLLDSHIEVLRDCSFSKSEKYYSARKEGIQTGRIVSGIMSKK